MPPTEKHYATSSNRVGQAYEELHDWIDDPVHKFERHDFTRIWEYGPLLRLRFGEEGVREYIEHLREDMATRLAKLLGKPSEELLQACLYFGINQSHARRSGKHDLDLLQPTAFSREDSAHAGKGPGKARKVPARTLQPW